MSKRHITQHLIPALDALREHLLAVERAHAGEIRAARPECRDSARNLLNYLALRQSDLRDLQRELGLLGLSRLGRGEAHVLSSLDAVLAALRALAGEKPRARRKRKDSVDLSTGDRRLEEHARALLGQAAGKRATRVMVTMPSEAADQPELIRDLLLAGMDVMRINCAHDDAEAWLAMIRHLRAAEAEIGRACKVYADLAGPKLRTGALKPAGRLAQFAPRRDVWGTVIEPAPVWLTPRGSNMPPPDATGTALPVDDDLLALACEGDVLEVEDSRGLRRRLCIMGSRGKARLAHADRHVYLKEGAACALLRGDERLARGRIGPLPEVVLPLLLRPGDRLLLTGAAQPGEAARVDAHGKLLRPAAIPCTLDAVFEAAAPGQRVWFDDGRIGGRIVANDEGVITVEILHAAPQGSKLRPEKGINLPDTRLAIPALTGKDLTDLRALAAHVDMVGLSFVREPSDVLALEADLASLDAGHLGIVLKIETRQAFENLPMILLASLRSPPVGLMVARGDLAVEIGFERLAEVQEEILWLAEAAHIPVIWAPQVLESMAKRGVPSRAEVSDAALGVRAECVMLNKGPYIVATVRFLADILERMSTHRKEEPPYHAPPGGVADGRRGRQEVSGRLPVKNDAQRALTDVMRHRFRQEMVTHAGRP